MRKHIIVAVGLLFAAAAVETSAHAVANHKIEQVQKIVRKNPKTGKREVVGARVHLLIENESYANFRVNVAPQKKLTAAQKKVDVNQRKLLAGMIGDFIYGTVLEKKGVAGQSTIEAFADINYKELGLKPGQKVNILASFTNDKFTKTSKTGPHTYGAWDGPVNQGDKDYVITLPSADTRMPVASNKIAAVATAVVPTP